MTDYIRLKFNFIDMIAFNCNHVNKYKKKEQNKNPSYNDYYFGTDTLCCFQEICIEQLTMPLRQEVNIPSG